MSALTPYQRPVAIPATPVVTFTQTRPGGHRANPTTEYSALLRTVRDSGLLRRRTGYYVGVFAILTILLGGLATAFVLIGDSWWQLIIAAALGILLTQYAFLTHEASHRQVFESGKANDVVGRTLANMIVGISYSWWMTKHSRHHANPNVVGKDPDIERDVVSFTEEDAAKASGIYGRFTKQQGRLFFPILIFEGLNLHLHGFRTVFGRQPVDRRWVETLMLLIRVLGYLVVVFLMLPLGLAFAFIGVQLAVFGLYMGASFAPNHIGMPILPRDAKVDFLRRQVLTSRNISGGWFINIFMGGLNYQVEHHLFPNMPRPALKQAQSIARAYCDLHDISYTESTLPQAYRAIVAHMNVVGLAAGRQSMICPAAASFGR